MRLTRIALFTLTFSIAVSPSLYAYTLLQVIPIIQLNELYDDNIQLTPSHAQGDFVTDLLLGAYLSYRGADRDGSFQYETVGEKFAQHQQYDDFGSTHFIQWSDRERLSERTKLSVDDWFLTGKIPSSLLTSGSVADATPSLNAQLALAVLARIRSISNFFDAELRHDFSERNAAAIDVKQEYFATRNTTSTVSSVGPRFDHLVSPHILVGAGYRFYDFRFTNSPSPVEAQYPQLRIRWEPSRRLAFEGHGGPIFFARRGGSNELKPGYEGTMAYENSRWRVRIGGGQTPGITASGGAGITQSAVGDVGYSISKDTTFFAGTSYYELLGGQSPMTVMSYGGGVNYRFARRVSIYGEYVALSESGNGQNGPQIGATPSLAQGTVHSNIVMFGVSISFEAFRRAL